VTDLSRIIFGDAWRVAVLVSARDLGLPDWAIGAGFVRSAVWDHLHAYPVATSLPDVDLLYFDRNDVSIEREKEIELQLLSSQPGVPWQVRNQARMHLQNGDPPYRDTEDGIRNWLETATAVAVRLEADDTLTFITPWGTADLLAMRSNPTPRGRDHYAAYLARMRAKNWPARWPKVRVEGL